MRLICLSHGRVCGSYVGILSLSLMALRCPRKQGSTAGLNVLALTEYVSGIAVGSDGESDLFQHASWKQSRICSQETLLKRRKFGEGRQRRGSTCSSDLHVHLSSPLFGLGEPNRTPGQPRPSRSLAIDFIFAPNVAATQAFSPPPSSLALFY
jgi:hypothetical protein